MSTAGNPLYASQLVRHWMDLGRAASEREGQQGRPTMVMPEGVPPSPREVVWSRVRALGQDVFAVLGAASVLGLEFPEDILLEDARPAGRNGARSPRRGRDGGDPRGLAIHAPGHAIRACPRRQRDVLRDRPVQSGPYARTGRRASTKDSETVHPDLVLQLARHCALAGLPEEALHWSVSAGDHAFAHLAPAEAADHYQVALNAAEALHRSDDSAPTSWSTRPCAFSSG